MIACNPGQQRIERYVRRSIPITGGGCVEIGLSYTADEDILIIEALHHGLSVLAIADICRAEQALGIARAAAIAKTIEGVLLASWPGRWWWLEVWRGEDALCQSYKPFPVPQ